MKALLRLRRFGSAVGRSLPSTRDLFPGMAGLRGGTDGREIPGIGVTTLTSRAGGYPFRCLLAWTNYVPAWIGGPQLHRGIFCRRHALASFRAWRWRPSIGWAGAGDLCVGPSRESGGIAGKRAELGGRGHTGWGESPGDDPQSPPWTGSSSNWFSFFCSFLYWRTRFSGTN